VRKLRALFDIVDADESGELDREEVAQLSKDMGAVLSEAELDAAAAAANGGRRAAPPPAGAHAARVGARVH
jgi:Ca2+-binding EF-hand superfamily protein